MAEKEYGMNIGHLLPHYDVILYLGQYYKASVPVGCTAPLADVTKQSSREISGQDQRVIAAYHDWNAEKVIPSGTLCMNITENLANLSTVVGPIDLSIFFYRSIMQPLIIQLDSNILQMCTRY